MSQGTSETVECPLCEVAFDPSAAGGWCTNSDCGEWQYEPETGDDAAESTQTADDAAGETDDDAAAASEPDAAEGSGPDATEGSGGGDVTEESESDAVGDEADDERLVCPGCGEAVGAEDNFCANCGEDVSALEPGPLEACPNCEESVDAEDNFCVNCGENLEAYRAETHDDAASEDDADADADRASVASPSTSADADDAGERPIEESLKLVVRSHEIRVWDGDTVGRKVRGIVIETGGDEEDAVRIHREHVRFVREGDQFYVKALGQNPTVVNGDRLERGDRVAVDPEDRIELSGVARMRVEKP